METKRSSEPTATPCRRAATTPGEMQLAGGMRLSKWRKLVGISRTTAWRLRKTGKLKVVVRYGQPFVSADVIRNFFSDDGTMPRTPGSLN